METNLLDKMLSTYLTTRASVTITLQNKIRVSGFIKAFDSYVIVLHGQKSEIVYRHAVSCIALGSQEEPKRAMSIPPKPAVARVPAVRPSRTDTRTRPSSKPQPALTSPSNDSINNSMKEGLLKWMQEQKAAK